MRLDGLRGKLVDSMKGGGPPGLVAAVYEDGEAEVLALGSKEYGGPAIERETIFRITSMSKPVTAAATMALVEDSKVSLDEPVDRLLPELAGRRVLRSVGGQLEDTVPADRPILVRDLLTFVMGTGILMEAPGKYPIQRATESLSLGQGFPDPPIMPPPDEWMKRLGTLPLMAHPGQKWMYNTGADVLGVLIARASGEMFESYLRRRIFGPLGMRDTGFSVKPGDTNRFATSYRASWTTGATKVYDPPVGGRWNSPPKFQSGAGGLVSTADDFLRFSEMMLGLGEFKGSRVLSEESVKEMTRDQLTPGQKVGSALVRGYFETHGWGYCMSVVTRKTVDYENVGRYGWDGGFGTTWYCDPKERAAFILMTQFAMASPAPPSLYLDFWKSSYSALQG